jgi:hypothetical protein
MSQLDPEPLKAVCSSKKLKYHAIFPKKIVLNNMMRHRDNSTMNYLLGYPDYLFAAVIYILSENKGRKIAGRSSQRAGCGLHLLMSNSIRTGRFTITN